MASKKELSDFSKGAMKSGTLMAPETPPTPKEVPMGEMQDIDDTVAAQQKANLADPSRAAALEKMATARLKFLRNQ